jgi:hypothetical protein
MLRSSSSSRDSGSRHTPWRSCATSGNVPSMTHTKYHGAGEGRSEGKAGNFPLERDELPR